MLKAVEKGPLAAGRVSKKYSDKQLFNCYFKKVVDDVGNEEYSCNVCINGNKIKLVPGKGCYNAAVHVRRQHPGIVLF